MDRKLNIIALDNENTTLTAISFLITAMGHDVSIFTNATDALSSLENNFFDIALIDYRLPGKLNGVNVIDEINKSNSQTECFLITGDHLIESDNSQIKIINKPLTDKKLKQIFYNNNNSLKEKSQ